jgi:hypothetical protein
MVQITGQATESNWTRRMFGSMMRRMEALPQPAGEVGTTSWRLGPGKGAAGYARVFGLG